jgi:hypothetical protein
VQLIQVQLILEQDSCYGAGTTFCVYNHFRQQILTIQASTYTLCLLIVSGS